MDGLTIADQTEREIEATMREQGVDRIEAAAIVGMRHGTEHGEGDLLCVRPLSEALQRRLGIGRSIAEVLAEQHSRRKRNGNPATDPIAGQEAATDAHDEPADSS